MSDTPEIFLLNPHHRKVLEGERAEAVKMTPGAWGCLIVMFSPFWLGPATMLWHGGLPGLLFVGMWYAVLGTMFVKVRQVFQQKMRVIREGTLCGGIVKGTSLDKDDEGDPVLRLEGRYTDPSGVTRDGQARQSWKDESRPVPEPGTPIAVLFLDEKNYLIL